jgi:hypothetical protein
MDIREKLLSLHEEIHGGDNEFSMTKSDTELIIDLIVCLSEEIEKTKDHSHTVC